MATVKAVVHHRFSPFRGAVAAVVVAGLSASLCAAAPPADVERLSDPDPAVREAAMTDFSTALNDPAQSERLRHALTRAAESDDVELRRRAQVLLLQESLGLVPGLDETIVHEAWTARWADSPAGRSRARQALAAAVPASAPVIAELLVDLLGDSDGPEPPLIPPSGAELEQALTELWPRPRYAVPLIVHTLRARGHSDVARQWIAPIAAKSGDPVAAHHLARLAADEGDLDELIAEWQQRVRTVPSAPTRRALIRFLRHAGRPVPPDLFDDPEDARREAMRREAMVLLEGEPSSVPGQTLPDAEPDDDEKTLRLLIDAAFASLAEDQAVPGTTDAALLEHVEERLRQQRERPGRDRAVEPTPGEQVQARHLAIACLAVGRVDDAIQVAEPVFPSAALTVLHRRMDFARAHQLAESAPEWPQETGRRLRVTSMGLRQELAQRGVRVAEPPRLTKWSTRVVEAAETFRKGSWTEAHDRMSALAEADPTQPGYAYAAAVAHEELEGADPGVEADAARALQMPLGDAWLRREMAEVLWMIGRSDAALRQYREASKLALAEEAGAPLMTIYAGRLAEAGQWQRAIEAFQVAILLLAIDPPAPGIQDSWLYFALFSHANIEHARMRLALENDDLPSAKAHRRAALELLPGMSDPTIDLVAWHDARGETREATEVFNDGFGPLIKASSNWPQSPVLANQAAWLAARCGRRLDTGLTLARTAIAGDPRSAAALDTLAEMHLVRGEGERAVALMWQVVALAEDETRFADYVLRLASIRDRAALQAAQGGR